MQETVRLTRKVSFSSGHRYWIAALSEEENRRLFGEWASQFNHGHNYTLFVTTEGQVDTITGMVVNIKDIDDVLKSVIVDHFDGKSINDEIEYFFNRASSTENILGYIAEKLASDKLPPQSQLVGLRLEETLLLSAELQLKPTRKMTLTRVYEFAASHRLHSPALSQEENLELFGKCNNPAGHGHNYILEVTVSGEPSPDTGMIADIGEIDRIVNDLVVDRYDHKNLNCDIPEFEGRPTSSEIVVQEIFRRLDNHLPAKLDRVRLHETARNIFEVSA